MGWTTWRVRARLRLQCLRDSSHLFGCSTAVAELEWTAAHNRNCLSHGLPEGIEQGLCTGLRCNDTRYVSIHMEECSIIRLFDAVIAAAIIVWRFAFCPSAC